MGNFRLSGKSAVMVPFTFHSEQTVNVYWRNGKTKDMHEIQNS